MEIATWPLLWLALLVGRWFAATSLPMYYTRTGSGKVSSPMGAQQERGGAVGPGGLEAEAQGLRVPGSAADRPPRGARDVSSQVDEAEPQAWHRHIGFVECGILAGLNEGDVGEVFYVRSGNALVDDGGAVAYTDFGGAAFLPALCDVVMPRYQWLMGDPAGQSRPLTAAAAGAFLSGDLGDGD